jgi:hypothetical protein
MIERLERELARWEAQGRVATLWLRDDDATEDGPLLRRLLALADACAVPVAIAAIPGGLDPSLRFAIDAFVRVTVVQHGYAHRNHAPPGERHCELGGRDIRCVLDELESGRSVLANAFGERFAPILVPPWNRIDEALLPHLADAAFDGLSRFGARRARFAAAHLPQVNTHVDLVAWRGDRAFIGAEAALTGIVGHLAARRAGACDPDEPTGLLTHHGVLGGDALGFLRDVLEATARHRAARWLAVDEVFANAAAVTCARSA